MVSTDASGTSMFTASFPLSAIARFVTATATRMGFLLFETSEFSACEHVSLVGGRAGGGGRGEVAPLAALADPAGPPALAPVTPPAGGERKPEPRVPEPPVPVAAPAAVDAPSGRRGRPVAVLDRLFEAAAGEAPAWTW